MISEILWRSLPLRFETFFYFKNYFYAEFKIQFKKQLQHLSQLNKTNKMTQKLSNLNIVLGYWKENMNQGFRFNNPKQYSNWIILVSFCSSHLAIKNCYNVHFMKIQKIDAKIDFSAKIFKKFVYYNEELVHKFNFQTQLSRKLQRFRTCRKNKKCSIFHDLFEYIIFPYGCKLLD